MDANWMDKRLSAALEVKYSYDSDVDCSDYDSAENNVALLLQDQYALNAILRRLNQPPTNAGLPLLELNEYSRPDMDEWGATLVRAQGVVGDMADVAEKLQPQSPTLSASQLHPWVWQAASPFWQSGHYAAAAETGAKSLTGFIQQKAGLSLADRELAAEVFSQRGREGKVRLWLPGDRHTDTWRSRQDGLHYLAMGAYAGIRNVAAHAVETGWTEQDALECLAVLSTVARWASETEVVANSGE